MTRTSFSLLRGFSDLVIKQVHLFKASSQRKRLLREGGWVFSGQILSALFMLAGVRLLTEFLPKDVFGAISLLMGLVALGNGIFCSPLLQASLRFYPEMAQRGRIGVFKNAIRRMLNWAALFLAATILLSGGAYTLSTGITYWTFVAMAALLIAEVNWRLETSFLTTARRQKAYSIWITMEKFARPTLAVLAVLLLGASPHAVLIGYLAAVGGVYLLFSLVSRKTPTAQREGGETEHPRLVADIRHYALPLMPLAAVGWLLSYSDKYIIGGMLGLERVAIYAACYGLICRPFAMVSGMIATTLRPVYYEAVSAKDRDTERKILKTWFLTTVFLSLIGVLGVFLFCNWIAFLLLAESYRSAVDLMPVLALGFAILATGHVFENPCYAHKQTKWILLIEGAGALAALLIGVPMVYYFGVPGAALTVPLYSSIYLATGYCASKKVLLRAGKSVRTDTCHPNKKV